MSIRWEALATQALTFVLVVVLLRKFFWKKIQAVLAARRRSIESQLEEIEATKKSLEGLRQEYRQELELASEEVRAMLQMAASEGERISVELRESAKEEAARIRRNAHEHIEEESARAEAEMGGRLADLATRAAGLAIQDGLDLESHRKILDAVIREIASGREVAR